jgi:hypothetical protein
MNIRENAGRISKFEGHQFEKILAGKLRYNVDGRSTTKVDIFGKHKMSVKNPSGKNTQISLSTQKKFIKAFNLEGNCLSFVNEFFGGENYIEFDRHRKKWFEINEDVRNDFLTFLNSRLSELFKFIFTHGFEMEDHVNVFAWATIKNDVDSVVFLDLEKVKEDFSKGVWSANDTTLEFRIDGKKLLHIQMKGSGKKYTSGYHGIQIHVHGNFKDKWNITL